MIDSSFLNQISEPLASARVVPTLEQCTIDTTKVDALSLLNERATPAEFIHHQMIKNANGAEAKSLRNLLRPESPRRLFDPSYMKDFLTALATFKRLVGEGQPWDFKHVINRLPKRMHRFGGRNLKTDVWGNVHYGFVGRASGFSRYTLFFGASFHQYWKSKSDPMDELVLRAFQTGRALILVADDPRDTIAIELGMRLYEQTGANPTIEQFEREVEAAPMAL